MKQLVSPGTSDLYFSGILLQLTRSLLRGRYQKFHETHYCKHTVMWCKAACYLHKNLSFPLQILQRCIAIVHSSRYVHRYHWNSLGGWYSMSYGMTKGPFCSGISYTGKLANRYHLLSEMSFLLRPCRKLKENYKRKQSTLLCSIKTESIDRWIDLSVSQSVSKSINQSVSPSVYRSVDETKKPWHFTRGTPTMLFIVVRHIEALGTYYSRVKSLCTIEIIPRKLGWGRGGRILCCP